MSLESLITSELPLNRNPSGNEALRVHKLDGEYTAHWTNVNLYVNIMKIGLQFRGRRFHIYAIILDNGSCPAVEFLEQVKRSNDASHRSLVCLYTFHADYGPIRNERKSRIIEGKQNLWEFKSNQGDRFFFFYLPGGRTVLTHGFHKGAPAKTEYKKAEAMRDRYLREVENGQQ